MASKGETLKTEQALAKEDFLLSANKRFKLILQDDGNLVLYRNDNGQPLWSTNTPGKPVSKAIMQADGNFVLYNSHEPLWASNTVGKKNASLIVQNDGNVVISERDKPVWSTNTGGS
jgi:hypothetical protein